MFKALTRKSFQDDHYITCVYCEAKGCDWRAFSRNARALHIAIDAHKKFCPFRKDAGRFLSCSVTRK